MRKIKDSFDILAFPPGLLILRHENPEALDTFFSSFSPEAVSELQAKGYTLVGLGAGFSLEHLSKAELKRIGLKKIKGR